MVGEKKKRTKTKAIETPTITSMKHIV